MAKAHKAQSPLLDEQNRSWYSGYERGSWEKRLKFGSRQPIPGHNELALLDLPKLPDSIAISLETISALKPRFEKLRAAIDLPLMPLNIDFSLAQLDVRVNDDPELRPLGFEWGTGRSSETANDPTRATSSPLDPFKHFLDPVDRLFALRDPAAPLSPQHRSWALKHGYPDRSKGENLIHHAYVNLLGLRPSVANQLLAAAIVKEGSDKRFSSRETKRLNLGTRAQREAVMSQIPEGLVNELPVKDLLRLFNFFSDRLLCFLDRTYLKHMNGGNAQGVLREYNRSISLYRQEPT